MHDLHCKNADEMYSKVLSERVRELKETQRGVDAMCSEMEKLYHEGMERGEKLGYERGEKLGYERGEKLGMERGEMKTKKEAAISFAKMGMSIEQIAQGLKENVSLIQEWIAEGMAVSR